MIDQLNIPARRNASLSAASYSAADPKQLHADVVSVDI